MFTDRVDSCVNNPHALNTKEIFNYPGPSTNTAGLYLDNLGLFVCGGLRGGVAEAGCYYHLYTPIPDNFLWAKFDYDTGTDVFDHQGILDSAIETWDFDDDGLGFFQVGGQHADTKLYKLELEIS